jgi:outer membrane receptor protein involved in Fe transport
MSAISQTRARALNGAARLALLGAGVLVLAAPAGVAFGQSAGAPPADAVSEIVVTGSRIVRKDADSVGPLSTVTKEDIERSGASSVGELLQQLPAAGVSLNTNGTQGTSYGASSINLRYLGSSEGSGNRVLVLVDGHRWVDAVGQRGFRDFTDLNTLPLGMIEGIEVLKDGASAIYGADAIAGVVNVKTVRNLEGFVVSAKAGASSHGDGESYSGYVNWGHRFERGSLFASVSYVKDRPILTSDRDLTANSLVPVTSPPTSPRGLYILPGLSNNAYFGTPTGFGAVATPFTQNTLGGAFGPGSAADNSFHTAALPGDNFNTQAQGIYSVGPSERWGGFLSGKLELTDHMNLTVEGLYNRRQSNQLFSPLLLSIGGNRGTVRGFALAVNQLYNPFGTANGVPAANALGFTASQAFEIRLDMTDLGNRNNIQDVTTERLAAGLDGDVDLFGRNWKWDLYGAFSTNEMKSSAENSVNYDALALSLGNPALCAATAGCVPVNLFGPMTPQMANYIRYTARETNETKLADVTFNVTGELIDLPAGPLGVAVGWEYRQNSADDNPDPFVNATPTYLPATSTTTSAQTRTPTHGKYSLNELYAEFAVPVLTDLPLAESLDLSLAARYSDYDTVGSHTTYKVGVGYRPISDILIRGTYAQGFRAPSIIELYQGARQTDFQGTDPCNGGAAAHPNLPGCAGVPTGYNQANFNGNGLLRGTISGNADLMPETSESYSAGFALKPRFAPGLAITSDWYSIKIENAIASQSATQILSLCGQQGGVFCDLVVRDKTTGQVLNLIQGAQNLNSIETSGIDSTIRYDFPTAIGRFAAVLDTSYLAKFRTISPNPAGGAPIVDDRAGKGDQPRSTYPHWKGQASLRWSDGPAALMWRARYIGSSTDMVNPVKDATTRAIVYHDLEASYALGRYATDVTVGMNNIFDTMPPASYANAPINFDIYTYDVRGRFLYVKVGARF